MNSYSLSHLADQTLLRDFVTLVTHDCSTTAALLAHLAEVDERKLHVPAGYPSMYLFLVRKLHMSEDTAFKRIRAARAARQFPTIFDSLGDGRLNLTAVVLLAPHLTSETADELLSAAAHKTNTEIGLLLAQRFPRPDVPTVVQAIAPSVVTDELAVRPVAVDPRASGAPTTLPVEVATRQLVPNEFRQLAVRPVTTIAQSSSPAPIAPPANRARVAPLSPGRFALQVTVCQATHDKLRYAQALLGHALSSGDLATVLDRALDELVEKLERQKFARSARSRARHGAARGRYVPAEVRRTVWQRDGGQCTFVSESGKRCGSTTRLEFDHVDPVARGGQTTVDRMRLRCRAHNQYEAECTFGVGFMRGKRQEARYRTALAQERAHVHGRSEAATGSALAAPVASGTA
jgi:hypothetical protein